MKKVYFTSDTARAEISSRAWSLRRPMMCCNVAGRSISVGSWATWHGCSWGFSMNRYISTCSYYI